MLNRELKRELIESIKQMPVVVLLGPRQVGKTTLALEMINEIQKPVTYLDLELDSDLNKLSDPESFLRRFDYQFLIIDEIQRKPELFRTLRAIIDIRKRKGENSAQFLLLGSASRDLLKQSTETLAGRVRYLELGPFNALEVFSKDPSKFFYEDLWLRGGFPNSFLAVTEKESWNWRNDFIATYVERDIPNLGPQISPVRMKRFWTLLAHYHGGQINYTEIGKSMELSHTTIKSYLEILVQFFMVREIPQWSGNTKKRLIKSPKIFIRDSGLVHKLMNVLDFESLWGHPILGSSWEGFVLENIIAVLPNTWRYSFYRTTSQTEIDFVLEGPSNQIWAIEVKRSSAPKLKLGFFTACDDINANKKFLIYSGKDQYSLPGEVEVIGLIDFMKLF